MQHCALPMSDREDSSKNQNPTAMLMSQFFIHIPKPQVLIKMVRDPEPSDPSHSSNALSPDYYQKESSKRQEAQIVRSHKSDSNWTSGTSGKYSVSSSGLARGEKQIILEWIRKRFERSNLLGPHWERILAEKKRFYLSTCFHYLKHKFNRPSPQNIKCSQIKRPDISICQGFQKLDRVLYRKIRMETREAWKKMNFKQVLNKNKVHFAYEQGRRVRTTSREYSNTSGSADRVGFYQNPPANSVKNPVYEYQNNNLKLKKISSAQHIAFSNNEYSLAPLVKPNSFAPQHQERNQLFSQNPERPLHGPVCQPVKVHNQIKSFPDMTPTKEVRPLSYRPQIIQSNCCDKVIPGFNFKEIPLRKRPVSAAPLLRVSCQFERQQISKVQLPDSQNIKYLKMSLQNFPQEAGKWSFSPAQHQNCSLRRANDLVGHFHQKAPKKPEEVQGYGILRSGHFIDNDYHLQGLMSPRSRNMAPPRILPN